MEAIHRAKTGALIRVSVVAGGVYAGADLEDVARLTIFGLQGRPGLPDCGRRARHDRGLSATGQDRGQGPGHGKGHLAGRLRHRAEPSATPRSLIEEAFAALEPYGSRADGLKAVARYLVERKN